MELWQPHGADSRRPDGGPGAADRDGQGVPGGVRGARGTFSSAEYSTSSVVHGVQQSATTNAENSRWFPGVEQDRNTAQVLDA